jgi:hypothetical protein
VSLLAPRRSWLVPRTINVPLPRLPRLQSRDICGITTRLLPVWPPPGAVQDLAQLLPCIRFPLMNDAELAAVAAHPMCGRSVLLQELLLEAAEARREEDARGPQARSSTPAG